MQPSDLLKIAAWTCKSGSSGHFCCFVRLVCGVDVVPVPFTWPKPTSQDAAHDLDVLRKFKVTHVLNVAYGVANPFPHLLHYRTVTLLDLPDTDITSYFPEGCAFIEEARAEEGVVLVHCNAGVSRSSSMVIGYLMTRERLAFNDAFSQVKAARPSICPNPGFLLQLKNYNPQASTSS
ncbi:dual specificity protein phosphatase 19-like isoform X3 [Hypomesus transpacificus]|uniref:dual specificity protein phosphatase 19-like isoform X3 n=1 Tax=Hypomesus transpacificus TaxID=137520 RepID=UPI001F074D91|nr:dual specificity protein phosphatase 19-like isoform X3 [Hypomesus transpacificus]